jgi:hypothetical protein
MHKSSMESSMGTDVKIIAGCSKRLSSKAAASEDRRRYRPHFVGPFARTMNLGKRKNPTCISDLRESQSVR